MPRTAKREPVHWHSAVVAVAISLAAATLVLAPRSSPAAPAPAGAPLAVGMSVLAVGVSVIAVVVEETRAADEGDAGRGRRVEKVLDVVQEVVHSRLVGCLGQPYQSQAASNMVDPACARQPAPSPYDRPHA